MGKNILVLSGSPRKGGTTDSLVSAFIEGATGAGNAVTNIRVADLKIGGCLGCNHCFREEGVCVQKDDARQILDRMKESDALVFASPIYFFGVTAQLKLAIDRTYALLSTGTPVKRAALLLTCGADSPGVTEPAIAMFRAVVNYQQWVEAGVVVAHGLHKPEDIKGRPELEQAKQIGINI
ncbi:flavodoxin family protein [Synergistales bacterium]|nr:flavodoxin family protein [Synergistales bacterium]